MSLNYTKTVIGAAGSVGAGFAIEFGASCNACVQACICPSGQCSSCNCLYSCRMCYRTDYGINNHQFDVSCAGDIYVSLPMGAAYQVAKINSGGNLDWQTTMVPQACCAYNAHNQCFGGSINNSILYNECFDTVHLWYISCFTVWHNSFCASTGDYIASAACRIPGGWNNCLLATRTSTRCQFGIQSRYCFCSDCQFVVACGDFTCLGGIVYNNTLGCSPSNNCYVGVNRHSCSYCCDVVYPNHILRYESTIYIPVRSCCSGWSMCSFTGPVARFNCCLRRLYGSTVVRPVKFADQYIFTAEIPCGARDIPSVVVNKCLCCVGSCICVPYCCVLKLNGMPDADEGGQGFNHQIMKDGSCNYYLFSAGRANNVCGYFLTKFCFRVNCCNPTLAWSRRITNTNLNRLNQTGAGLFVDRCRNNVVLTGGFCCQTPCTCTVPFVISLPLGVEPPIGTYGNFVIESNLTTFNTLCRNCFTTCFLCTVVGSCCTISSTPCASPVCAITVQADVCDDACDFTCKTSIKG